MMLCSVLILVLLLASNAVRNLAGPESIGHLGNSDAPRIPSGARAEAPVTSALQLKSGGNTCEGNTRSAHEKLQSYLSTLKNDVNEMQQEICKLTDKIKDSNTAKHEARDHANRVMAIINGKQNEQILYLIAEMESVRALLKIRKQTCEETEETD